MVYTQLQPCDALPFVGLSLTVHSLTEHQPRKTYDVLSETFFGVRDMSPFKVMRCKFKDHNFGAFYRRLGLSGTIATWPYAERCINTLNQAYESSYIRNLSFFLIFFWLVGSCLHWHRSVTSREQRALVSATAPPVSRVLFPRQRLASSVAASACTRGGHCNARARVDLPGQVSPCCQVSPGPGPGISTVRPPRLLPPSQPSGEPDPVSLHSASIGVTHVTVGPSGTTGKDTELLGHYEKCSAPR